MMGGVRRLFLTVAFASVWASTAFAQAGQSLSGIVVDTAGGVIPGASWRSATTRPVNRSMW
jgi:hypothetical protein